MRHIKSLSVAIVGCFVISAIGSATHSQLWFQLLASFAWGVLSNAIFANEG